MTKSVKCSANLPSRLIALAQKRMEDEKVSSFSEYLQNIIMEERLSPATYILYRIERNPDCGISDPYSPCRLLTTDDWLENSNLGELEKINFSLPEDLLSFLDVSAKEAVLTRTKIITICMMRDLSEQNVYLAYRSIFDKPWLYKFFRKEFNMKHEDDTADF